MDRKSIIIATIKSWNIDNANKLKKMYKDKYDIYIVKNRKELVKKKIQILNPRYIFFPHWSWMIPKGIYKSFECIVFHMTDLPYGRGGSPLQNLIINKIYNTKISAIKVEGRLDAGRIYLKEPFHITTGSAEDILKRVSGTVFFKMIPYILNHDPIPHQQKGKIVVFKRRSPEESNMGIILRPSLKDIYDFIRMLDAEGYPKAFLKLNTFKITFFDAHKNKNKLEGRFEIIDHSCPN